jgi:hypothetical protein
MAERIDKTARLQVQIGELEFKFRGLVAQRDNLDRQIEQMKIRLDTYKDALALVTGAPAPAQQSREGANLFKPTETGAAWRDSLEAMRATGTTFTTDMIFADVNSRGVKMIRPAVRGRLAELVDKRKLKRIREGVFEFPRGETAVQPPGKEAVRG